MNKRHFWLLVLLILALPMIAAIFQNTYTTQNPGKTPINLPALTTAVNPIVHSSGDGTVYVDPDFTQTGTNANLTGNLTNNGIRLTNSFQLITGGGANKVLTSDGSGNGTWQTASSGSSTNFDSLTVTNFIRGPRVVLTLGGTGGTNVTGFDLNLGTEFILILSTNAFFAAPSNLQNTNVWQNVAVHIIQDSTGTHTVKWTNSVFGWQGGAAPVQTTNAFGYDIYNFTTSALTNSTLMGVQTFNLHR